jgi:hypothetical protein
MGFKLRDLDAVDGRFRFTDLPDFLFRHLAEPKQSMSLEASVSKSDSPSFIESN